MVSWPNETSRVRRSPAFSPERQRLAAGLVLFPAGLVVGILAERAAFDWDDPRHWVPDLVVGLTFVGAAVVTVPRYPGSGWLLAATGFGWFLGNFDAALQYVHRGPLVHALVVLRRCAGAHEDRAGGRRRRLPRRRRRSDLARRRRFDRPVARTRRRCRLPIWEGDGASTP